MVNAGHAVVNNRIRARFDEAGWASEQMGGISYLFFLRQLVQQIDQDWPAVVKILQSIRDTLLTSANAICNITIDAENWKTLQPHIEDFLAGLPAQPASDKAWALPNLPSSEGLTIPSQVNYVGKGADLFKLGYTLKGSAFVINKYISDTWMWNKVRVQGGAYGGFCVFDSQSGVLDFLSYRDPNLVQTLDVYHQTGDFLKSLEEEESELTKVIIGTIGDLDTYLLPDAKGFTHPCAGTCLAQPTKNASACAMKYCVRPSRIFTNLANSLKRWTTRARWWRWARMKRSNRPASSRR